MKIFNKLAFIILSVTLPLGAAQAEILTGTFDITVYNGAGGGLITSPESQANTANPLLSTTALYSGVYNGDIDFLAPSGGSNNILSFLLSAGGSLSGDTTALNTTMSLGNFSLTTLLDITWYSGGIGGFMEHDDGVSLYVDGVSILDSSAPTSPIESVFSGTSGTYRLIYAAANDLPEVLSVQVPEPTILALLGLGLVGVGFTRRRNKA